MRIIHTKIKDQAELFETRKEWKSHVNSFFKIIDR